MSYVVLARKYRPRTFEEVAGQDVSSGVLRGAIAEERVGHAYLFSGPRGTGKTTTARIFAKALNCEKGPTPEPCGVCDRCVAADAGNDVDIVEIDAASHTGVDSVRDLRDQAAYMPLRARYKIYIIDEVHMLSRQAFNALLKTLEEPPPHVKFLFATTEPHKVIDTVLSRCQQLRLTALPEATIVARLEEIFTAEQVEAEEGVTAELARLARGGMRDALSLADQLLALVGSKPKRTDIERLASGAAAGGIDAVLDALEAGDRAAVLAALPKSEGDETELLENLLRKLRVGLLAALVGSEHASLVAGEEAGAQSESVADETAAARAKRLGPQRIELWLTELVHTRERMIKLPTQSRLLFELCLLDLCRSELSLPMGELVARLDALEARLQSGHTAPAAAPASAHPPAPAAPQTAPAIREKPPVESHAESHAVPQARTMTPKKAPAARRAAQSSPADAWKEILVTVAKKSPSLADSLEKCGKLVEFTPERAVVQLRGMREEDRVVLLEPRNQRLCTKAFESCLERSMEVLFQDTSDAKLGKEDPYTRHVADLFGGRIEDES